MLFYLCYLLLYYCTCANVVLVCTRLYCVYLFAIDCVYVCAVYSLTITSLSIGYSYTHRHAHQYTVILMCVYFITVKDLKTKMN